MIARLSLALLVVCTAVALASCGGHGAARIRIGVLADCEGLYGLARDSSYAGAEAAADPARRAATRSKPRGRDHPD